MGTSNSKTAIIAALTTIWPTLVPAQDSGGTTVDATTPATDTGATQTTAASVATTAPAAGGTAAPRGGKTYVFTLGHRLTYDDNYALSPSSPGGSWISDTTFGFDFSSVTQLDDLRLFGSAVLRYADLPTGVKSGLEDPRINLSYARTGANSRLTFDARFRRVDRDFLDPFDVAEEQLSTGLIGSGGTRTTRYAAISYRGGINDPIGFNVGLSHDATDYSNTTNFRLFDSTTDNANLTLFFTPSRVTQWSLDFGLTKYDSNDATLQESTTRDVSLGLTREIDPALSLNAAIGFSRIITDEVIGGLPVRSRDSGATGSFGLTKTLPNGTAGVTLQQSQTTNGGYTTLSFSRSLALPLGSLSASLGAVHTESGNTNWIGSLAYNRQLRSSDFTVSFDRSVSTNSLDEDVLDTLLQANYGYVINQVSRLDFSMSYGRSEGAGLSTVPTVQRTTLTASYTRNLTPDWDLTGGVQIRSRDETGVGKADSNSVFVSLGRSFSFRP